MKRQAKTIRRRTVPPVDLTGRRFGKWTVLKYAGQQMYYCRGERFSKRMWLCRCDCGLQREVPHHNLTGGLSTKCQRCCHIKHGVSDTRLYRTWDNLKRSGRLAREWQEFNVFRKAVGDPPDKKARLARLDRAKPHSPGNTFWMYSTLSQNDPAFFDSLRRLRKKSKEERVTHTRVLMQIRNAKTKDERDRYMVAARKAGYTLSLIGVAARLTRQGVHIIVSGRCR
jgi:hypothetical protein